MNSNQPEVQQGEKTYVPELVDLIGAAKEMREKIVSMACHTLDGVSKHSLKRWDAIIKAADEFKSK